MTDRLNKIKEIRNQEIKYPKDSDYVNFITKDDFNWLIEKVERYEKALIEISKETGTPYAEISLKALNGTEEE